MNRHEIYDVYINVPVTSRNERCQRYLFYSKNTRNAIFLARIFDFIFLIVQLNGRPGIGNQTSQVNFTLSNFNSDFVYSGHEIII